MKLWKTINNEIKLTILCILAILFIAAIYIPNAKIPGTTVDEFGYLFNAATLVGWDWKELMQYHPYYGMGMGILWFPLFWLLYKTPEVLYQSIVCLNFVFIIFSFCLSKYCSKKLFPKWKNELRVLACFAITFYPSNFFYSQAALSETFLYFLFWLLVALIIKTLESQRVIWAFLLGIIASYMVLVHLRTIGIAVCVGCLILFLGIKKIISWKKVLVFMAICVIGIIIWYSMKQLYFANLGGKNDINTINTEISILGMIYSMLFNIPTLVKGILGRFFYFFVSGNIFFMFGFGILIRDTYFYFFRKDIAKKEQTRGIIAVFLLVTFFINLVAFSTQTLHDITRVDMAVYGRYLDNMIGPILLFGIYFVTTKKNWKKNISVYILFVILLLPIVLYRMEEAETSTFAIDSAVAFGAFFKYDTSQYSIYLSLLKLVLIVILSALAIYFICRFFSKYKKLNCRIVSGIYICLLMFYWGYLGYGSITQYNAERSNIYTAYENIKDVVEKEECSDLIYIRHTDLYGTKAKYLQFLLSDISIQVVNYEDFLINDIQEKTLIICNAGDDISPILGDDYHKVWDETLDIYSLN